MNRDGSKRKLTAILSADVVGYSRLMEADEEGTIKNLEENKRLIGGLVQEYHGRVVDAPGDNMLAEFNSVTNAVECAVKIQQELKNKNDNLIETKRMYFRIGVNLGDIVEEGERIYGNGVNIAARLEGLAEPGGICISRTAFDQVISKLDLGYEYLGEHNVKNITLPVRVYRILMDAGTAGKVIGEKKVPSRKSFRIAVAAIIILIIIAVGSIGWNIYFHTSGEFETASVEQEQASAGSNVMEGLKTIAVLPFDDISPEKDQGYFVDGLSEEILNSLCKIPKLGVAGRTSSFSFKGSKKTSQEIARTLGVDYILEGSVRKSGNMLRITAQLIRAADDLHLWSETYDREFKDIFTVQEDIATTVAHELKLRLEFGKSLKQLGGTNSAKAYEYYLTAKGLIGQGSSYDFSSVTQEERLIESALSIDAEFALAWVRKAAIHNYYILVKPARFAATERDIALKAIYRAIELEPDLALGYHYLGSIKTGSGDFIGGELAIQKAFELRSEPFPECSITAFYHYGPVGRLKKAYEIIRKSRISDPLSPNNRQYYIASLAFLGDSQQAEAEYKLIREMVGKNQKDDMTITLVRLGTKVEFSPDDIIYSDPVFDLVKKYMGSPKKGLLELRRLFVSNDDLNFWNLYFIAMWAAYFGDPGFSIDIVDKAVKINASSMSVSWWPVMKEVRQLPEFKKLVREIGLVDYWKEYGWPDLCHPVSNDDFVCD